MQDHKNFFQKTNIYVLKLESGKYYIGKSDNINFRLEDHFNSNGSEWTKLFAPLSLIELIKNVSPFEEDKIVKVYMAKFGIENCRGGSYSNIKLEKLQIEFLEKEIWASTDLCIRCGRSSHFVLDCFANTNINKEKIKETNSSKHKKRKFKYYDDNEYSTSSSSDSS